MPKRLRRIYADAVARLMFRKQLDHLDRYERAELDFVCALAAEAADRERDEERARELPEEAGDRTLH